MADERLTADDWVTAGLKALSRSGAAALKADTLAKTLGVSRGSFYWHFADVGAFHAAVLHRWREVAMERIVADVERTGGDPLTVLVERAFAAPSRLESAVQAWAASDKNVRAVVAGVEAERVAHLQRWIVAASVREPEAAVRASILNWAYAGFVMSGRKLDSQTLRRVTDALVGLGKSPSAAPRANATRQG